MNCIFFASVPLFSPLMQSCRSAGVGGRMAHHGQVNIVELSQPHKLGLAAQKLQLALPPEGVSVFYLDVFLGGNCHERQPSAEGFQHV